LFRHFAMARSTAELVDDVAVPIELEPLQPIQDGGDRLLGRALAVCILDPEQHLAAAAARIKPVEQRETRPSDIEESGRRGSKAGDNGISHGRDRAGKIGQVQAAVVYSRIGT